MLDQSGHSLNYDPFSPAVMQNPLPFYEELRRDQPVLYLPKYDGYFLSRFDDIMEALRLVDNSLMQSEGSLPTPAALAKHNTQAPATPPLTPMPISQSLGMPIHGEVRRAHIKPMLPHAVADLTGFVRQRANEVLDGLLPQKSFNLIKDYGGIVAASVVTRLMGMPQELAGQIRDIINSGTRTDPELGGFDSSAVAKQAIQFYLPYVQARIDAGADGSVPMVDGIIHYLFQGRQLTAVEAAQQLVCAFIGGTETVPKITGAGLMELANRPEQLAAVRADLTRNGPIAVEEILRYCAPAQWFMRTIHKPVTIAGQEMKPGQRLFLLLGSAARDEREYPAPDEFHWDRPIKRLLSFGYGMHFCIGAFVARMEVQVMLDTFLRRVPDFHAGMFEMDKAVRHPSSFQWGWNDLPINIG